MSVVTLWPTAVEFVESVQDNKFAFADRDLKNGKPIVNRQTHEPLYTSGGFATVCYIEHRSRRFAVKFFVNPDNQRSLHYAAVSAALAKLNLPYMMGFEFIENGVDIRGCKYPILKMEYISGSLLHKYLEENLGDQARISKIADSWLSMSSTLRQAQIAHGDLQHRNVFVVNEELRLIDYDGMFVPQLYGTNCSESGLPSFQHPRRTTVHFGPYLDNFSDWVMYTTLIALSRDPSLWNLVNVEDQRLLFSRDDFLKPEESPLFLKLKNAGDSQVSFLANQLEALLKLDVQDIPFLCSQGVGSSNQPITLHTQTVLDIFGNPVAANGASLHTAQSAVAWSNSVAIGSTNSTSGTPVYGSNCSNGSSNFGPANSTFGPASSNFGAASSTFRPATSIFGPANSNLETVAERLLVAFGLVHTGTPDDKDDIIRGATSVAIVFGVMILMHLAAMGPGQFCLAILALIFVLCGGSFFVAWLYRSAIEKYSKTAHSMQISMPADQLLAMVENSLRLSEGFGGGWVPFEKEPQYGAMRAYHTIGSRHDHIIICDVKTRQAGALTELSVAFSGILVSINGQMDWDFSGAGPIERVRILEVMQKTLQSLSL